MSYMRKRVYQGMGGVENCGADQVWDANIEYLGNKGQCMPRKNYTAAQLENPNAFPTSVKGSSSGGGGGSAISNFFAALTAPAAVAPTGPMYYPAPASSGPSTTTLLLVGGGALALLFLATR